MFLWDTGNNTVRPCLTRRELLAQAGKVAGASSLAGVGWLLAGCGGEGSSLPAPPPGDGYPGTNDQLLEEIEAAGFLFSGNKRIILRVK